MNARSGTGSSGTGSAAGLRRGKVLWFSEEKGFGLIEGAGGERLVVEYTGISSNGRGETFKTLRRGLPVLYKVGENGRGRRVARDVRVFEEER